MTIRPLHAYQLRKHDHLVSMHATVKRTPTSTADGQFVTLVLERPDNTLQLMRLPTTLTLEVERNHTNTTFELHEHVEVIPLNHPASDITSHQSDEYALHCTTHHDVTITTVSNEAVFAALVENPAQWCGGCHTKRHRTSAA